MLLAAVAVVCLGISAVAQADDPGADRVDVPLHRSQIVRIPDVTKVTVLDDNVCTIVRHGDTIEILGTDRGETMVFAWIGDQRKAFLVHVTNELEVETKPTLNNLRQAPVRGVISTSVQTSTSSTGSPVVSISDRFRWEETPGTGRLMITGQLQQSTFSGTPAFNVNTATIDYQNGGKRLTLLDSSFNVSGRRSDLGMPLMAFGNYTFRGADFAFKTRTAEYEMFAGYTLPAYFLDNRGTRQVAGLTVTRHDGANVNLFATTGFVNTPKFLGGIGTVPGRQFSAYQLLGADIKLRPNWKMQFTSGASTRGMMGLFSTAFTTPGSSLSASMASSSAAFPLNQLQLSTSSKFAANVAGSHRFTTKLYAGGYFEHRSSGFDLFSNKIGASNYMSGNVEYLFNLHNRLAANYSHGSFASSLGSDVSTSKEEVVLSSDITSNIGNSVGFSTTSSRDPQHLSFQRDYTIRDDLNVRLHGRGTLQFSFLRQQSDPSLVSRIQDQIDLLPQGLRDSFLLSPDQFIASSVFTPQLRELFEGAQPSNTQFSVGGQFLIRNRLNISPTYSLILSQQGRGLDSTAHTLGYNLTFDLTSRMQLQSSMSNALLFDSASQSYRRTTVFTFGLTRTLSALPLFGSLRQGRTAIRGHVFRDMNVDGHYSGNDFGLGGITVHLSDGRTTNTDSDGSFSFDGLKHKLYEVSIGSGDLSGPARFTTSTHAQVDLARALNGSADFGLVDFARVSGAAFNDYLLNGHRQPDALPINSLQMQVLDSEGRVARKLKTDNAGEFEIDDLPAGTYKIAVDKGSLPNGYVLGQDSYEIHVGPVSSISLDVAAQALRSISGRVGYRESTENGNGGKQAPATPLPGVKLAIGDQVVTTDEQGNFVLRNLPAGVLTLRLVPLVQPPAGVKLPTWPITLPQTPIAAEGIKINLTNIELLTYLQPKIAEIVLPRVHNAVGMSGGIGGGNSH